MKYQLVVYEFQESYVYGEYDSYDEANEIGDKLQSYAEIDHFSIRKIGR